MSGMNSDQLHRSTLEIYLNLTEEFNPSLQKLVSLGQSYIQAFRALAVTSEAYFSALSRIGEKAFHTMSSHSLGDVLIQISDSQRKLVLELETVFRSFNVEVIQEMENNIRVDRDYISDSRKHYEMEVYSQATALERQLRRGFSQDNSEYVEFLRRSHSEAVKEEERRHRFLAEKHCGLIKSIAQLMNKTGDSLQQRADAWTDKVNVTRGPTTRRLTSVDNSMWMKEEEIRRNREEPTLGDMPSRVPSPQGTISYSRRESVGGEGGGGGRSMRALVAHQPSASNPTLLPFSRGEMITVLVQQPKNGWLFGRADSGSHQGWFPASYVEAVDEPPYATSSRRSNLGSSSSMSSLVGSGSYNAAPPPPPPPTSSSNRQSEVQPVTLTLDRRPEFNSEKRSNPHGSPPELFPRGTNPFATVKLRPTNTDDRSAPRLNR